MNIPAKSRCLRAPMLHGSISGVGRSVPSIERVRIACCPSTTGEGTMSRPRITIVGGGSTHWSPKLLVDFANTESLPDAEGTLMNVVAHSLPPMFKVAEHRATP